MTRQEQGVVATRAHTLIVTEYGAYLYGKNLRQRAKALISIAHPDDREALDKYCWERFKTLIFNHRRVIENLKLVHISIGLNSN